MLGGQRLDRVNELLRHEVSQLLKREVEIPTDVLVTITQAQVSPDLEHAKLWVSVLPTDRQADVMEQLNREIGRIQHLLNRKLVMMSVPKIRFVIDESGDRASRIEHLLDTLDEPS